MEVNRPSSPVKPTELLVSNKTTRTTKTGKNAIRPPKKHPPIDINIYSLKTHLDKKIPVRILDGVATYDPRRV